MAIQRADLPGANSPVLALTNVTSEQAGEYQAVVSAREANGTSVARTSLPAQLSVRPLSTNVELVIRPDRHHREVILLDVAGEPGQSYTVWSVTNLITGGKNGTTYSAALFPREIRAPYLDHPAQLFYRAYLYQPVSPICSLNLRQIHFAKKQLASELKVKMNGPISPEEVHRFLGVVRLTCPEGGVYGYYGTEINPTCSLIGHHLEGQN